MATKTESIRAQLDAGHPTGHTVGGTTPAAYDPDDAIAAEQMNALNLTAQAPIAALIEYLLINRTRSNQGADTTTTSTMGRLQTIAQSDVGTDPFARGTGTVTLEQKNAAQMIVQMTQATNIGDVNFADPEFEAGLDALAGGAGARVFKPADVDAIKALAQGATSVSIEQGFGTVRAGNIANARALT